MRPFLTALVICATVLLPRMAAAHSFTVKGNKGAQLTATPLARFDSPWAMSFISDTQLLVTTKPGKLWLVTTDGDKRAVAGVPAATVGGQGGLGDIVPHPDFTDNGLIYLSYVESRDRGQTRGAVVVRATLELGDSPRLTRVQRVWAQSPKARGQGHFSHRLAFGPTGSAQEGKLFITSGDRQEMAPAQDMSSALGKIIRLNDDGTVPADNPFQSHGRLAKSFWTIGHRNALGMAFDAQGRLWAHEMGPKHGDELNLITPGQNYGWPLVSMGDHYSGAPIPDHDTRPDLTAPKAFWVPSIAPSGVVIYDGAMFADWQGDALIGGLVARALIRVDLAGDTAQEVERFGWRKRIREVEQGPDGAIWVLEDRDDARLLRLTPKE